MYKFKELPDEEKPRERLKVYGVENLSNEELLMIILKSGTKKYSVKDMAFNLLKISGGMMGLKDMNLGKLLEVEGIGEVKAIELIAIIELFSRIYYTLSI